MSSSPDTGSGFTSLGFAIQGRKLFIFAQEVGKLHWSFQDGQTRAEERLHLESLLIWQENGG